MDQPKRRDKAATRSALLDAARRRFAQHGYDGTGVREIARDVGVDPALVFRYFGSKDRLYEQAVRVEVPEGLAADPARPLADIAGALLHDVVFADWEQYDGEHPLLVMLRSSGRPGVRDQLRQQICDGYLQAFEDRMGGADAALRSELFGALLVGMGVMRSVVGTPALSRATYGETRALVTELLGALAAGSSKEE